MSIAQTRDSDHAKTSLNLWGLLRRSLLHRRARSLSAVVAMTVSAGVATALLTLYADLDAKLHHEFRSFGANVVVTPADPGGPLPADVLARAQQAAGSEALTAQFAYAVATTDRAAEVVVAGVDFDSVRKLDAWWQVAAWPSTPDAALLGDKAAQFVADERAVKLTFKGTEQTFAGAGRLKTGSDEDSRIYVPMAVFREWTGISPSVLEVQIPGGAVKVQAALDRLRVALPGLQVEPVRQLVEGESRIVDKTHALMFGAVLLIALTVAVSVLATLSASVLERRRDFALMKALGGSQMQMIGLFLMEALLLALAGVAVGFIVGSATALAISEGNFGTVTLPRIGVLPVVIALNVVIAALASIFPAKVLRGLQPAALLKGE